MFAGGFCCFSHLSGLTTDRLRLTQMRADLTSFRGDRDEKVSVNHNGHFLSPTNSEYDIIID